MQLHQSLFLTYQYTAQRGAVVYCGAMVYCGTRVYCGATVYCGTIAYCVSWCKDTLCDLKTVSHVVTDVLSHSGLDAHLLPCVVRDSVRLSHFVTDVVTLMSVTVWSWCTSLALCRS